MIKKYYRVIVPAVVAVLSSCNKQTEPVNPPVIEVNIFTAGNEYDSESVPVPVIYKDSDELYRLEKGSTVTGVASVGKDVFACGYNAAGHPSVWKNGSVSNGVLSTLDGTLNDMVTDGADWFCCGSVSVEGEQYGIIARNGEEVFRCKTPSSFSAIDLGESGDWYVAGVVGDRVSVLRVSATKKDISSAITITDDLSYVPTDIYTGLRDICVSINHRTVDNDYAFCWISAADELIQLSKEASSAECVAIYNGAIFTGGWISGKSGNAVATQWTNGYAEDFSYGCNPGDSCVKLLRNGGYNLYEAVQSAGQIQLCCNGALMGTVKCSDSFDVEAWDIVRVR